MPPVLIVQRIYTRWDKSARGGKEAAQRNSAPEAAKVPFHKYAAENPFLMHQELSFGGRGISAAPHEKVIVNAESDSLVLESVKIDWTAEQARASFHWTRACGAPMRTGPRTTLILAVNEWGQIVYNGRFNIGYDSYWQYHKTVVNVGLFDPASNSVFTRSEPNQRYSAMAHLF